MIDISISKNIGQRDYRYNLKSNSKVIAIMGPSGSGKTTFLKLLSGLMKPDSGFISINDFVVYDDGNINLKTKKRKMAYIFQHDNIFPHLSVEENIKLGLKEDKSNEILSWLNKLGLGDIRNLRTANLSGGEKQRIALIRSILHNPQLLLLDEAFSSLDEDNKNILYEELKIVLKNFDGHTIVVTHDYKEAMRLAEEIYYLHNNEFFRVKNNYIEGTITKLIPGNRGDIFSIKTGDINLKGVLLKDFIKVGDSIKVEIEGGNVHLTNLNEIIDFDSEQINKLRGKVINKIGDNYEVLVDDINLFGTSSVNLEIPSEVDIYIKYKDVNVIK